VTGFSEFRSGVDGASDGGCRERLREPEVHRCDLRLLRRALLSQHAGPLFGDTTRRRARFQRGQRQRRPRGNGSSPVRPTRTNRIPTRGNAVSPSSC